MSIIGKQSVWKLVCMVVRKVGESEEEKEGESGGSKGEGK